MRQHAGRFGVDSQRLGITGSSAGGLLALIAAFHGRAGDPASEDPVERASSVVQAVGSFFAPTDLLNYGAESRHIIDLMQTRGAGIDPSFQFYHTDTTGVRRPVTSRDDVLHILREQSPASHVNPDDPPTILVHGEEDRAVPVQQSRLLIERLRAVRVPARLVTRAGAGHAYAGWEDDAAFIADWFDEHLRRRR